MSKADYSWHIVDLLKEKGFLGLGMQGFEKIGGKTCCEKLMACLDCFNFFKNRRKNRTPSATSSSSAPKNYKSIHKYIFSFATSKLEKNSSIEHLLDDSTSDDAKPILNPPPKQATDQPRKATSRRLDNRVLVEWCIEQIQATSSADIEGIYRKSGSVAAVNALQACFDAGELPNPEEVRTDARCVADLLKRHIRSMQAPLIPKRQHDSLLGVAKRLDANSNKQALAQETRMVIRSMPEANQRLAGIIFNHLGELAERESATRMTAESLAKVWTFNVFKANDGSQQPSSSSAKGNLMTQIEKEIGITELLITHHAIIFGTN